MGELLSSFLSIDLENYRNHTNFSLKSDKKFTLILGENGIGKTNVLEALSFFIPGRGLRDAKDEMVISDNGDSSYSIAKVHYNHNKQSYAFSIGWDLRENKVKKTLSVDNTPLKNRKNILNFLRVIWVTPQVENLFLEPQSVKRKYIDRITFNFFPKHLDSLLQYNYLMRSRNKILAEKSYYDENWLSELEKRLSALNVEIVKNRNHCIKIINSFMLKMDFDYLKPSINIKGKIEDNIAEYEKDISLLHKEFFNNRAIDGLLKRSNIGVHKSELEVFDGNNSRAANMCSSGEQKSMIIALLLAQSYAIQETTGIAPVLLLDEVFAHIDDKRKRELIIELEKTPSQAWITSTDLSLIKEFESKNSTSCFL